MGSIYAADTDRFSLAMVPQLTALANGQRSLLLAARRSRRTTPPAGEPLFYAPRAGMESLATATATAAGDAGATISPSSPVVSIESDGSQLASR